MQNKAVKTALDNVANTAKVMGFQQLEDGVFQGNIYNIYQEIHLLKTIVSEYKLKPFFRYLAVKIINNFPCQHKNYDCYIYAIAKWIRDNIKYVKDIEGYETLQTPDNTLRIGGGDCDDHAILAATLFEAIGMKTYFKIVGENGKYKHIYVVVKTPTGETWVVDTTEPDFFHPYEEDAQYEDEILEELGELGWSFKPFKALKRAVPKPKIKLKPKKFLKRATGGIRHPKRFVKQFKRKPLAFLNKRFREVTPKPTKAFRRAFSPIIKPIEHEAHKIEKLSPVKGIHLAKFLKRATASKSIDEAGIKIIGAIVAGQAAAPAVSSAAASGSGFLSTIGTTAGNVAKGVGKTLVTDYVFNKLAKGQQGNIPQQEVMSMQPPIQHQISAESMYQGEGLSYQRQGFNSNVLNNPLVIAAGILTIGLLLRR